MFEPPLIRWGWAHLDFLGKAAIPTHYQVEGSFPGAHLWISSLGSVDYGYSFSQISQVKIDKARQSKAPLLSCLVYQDLEAQPFFRYQCTLPYRYHPSLPRSSHWSSPSTEWMDVEIDRLDIQQRVLR